MSTSALGLSVSPAIRLDACSDPALFIGTTLPKLDLTRFDRWRFKVRVELDLTHGTTVTKSSQNIVENVGAYLYGKDPDTIKVTGTTQTSAPAMPQPADNRVVSELKLVLQTGGDDLRGDSEANAIVLFSNMPDATFLNINKMQRWTENSTETVVLPFVQEVKVDSIKGIQLTVSLGGGLLNGDNWKMNSVEVIAVVNVAPISIIGRSGNALYYFTGSNRDYTIVR